MINSITVEGRVFPSMRAAASHYGLLPYTVDNRLRYGWTIEEAFGIVRRKQQGKQIEVAGVIYENIKQAAEEYGLAPTTVRNRLTRGDATIEQAFGIAELSGQTTFNEKWQVTVGGTVFPTLAEAVRHHGKSYSVIDKRLRDGWAIDEAFDLTSRTPKHGYPGLVYKIVHIKTGKCYIGVTMRTVEERWAQHQRDALLAPDKNTPGSLRSAIVEYGPAAFAVSVLARATDHIEMQALEIKLIQELNTIKPHGFNGNIGGSGSMPQIKHAIVLNGENFPSISMAMRHHDTDLPYPTIIQRFKMGWTPEQAFGFEPPPGPKEDVGHRRAISVAGTEYPSIANACRLIEGAPTPNLVQNRLSKGWTPEEAFNLAPHADQRGKRPGPRDVLNDTPTSRNTTGYKGVSKHAKTGRWQASFSVDGKRIFVGLFDDAETAHIALQAARQRAA